MAKTYRHRSGGYALLAVLWLSLGIAGLALSISSVSWTAAASARNRSAILSARWKAVACLSQLIQTAQLAVSNDQVRPGEPRSVAWNTLDRLLLSPAPADSEGCTSAVRPVAGLVDVNSVEPGELLRLLRYAGLSSERADSLADTIVSHRPYVDIMQLHRLPGLEQEALLDSLLQVGAGPVVLNHSPGPVLHLLPGFTDETVRTLLERRNSERPIQGFAELGQLLSPDDSTAASRIPALAVFQPIGWSLTVRARSGLPPITVAMEISLSSAAKELNVGGWRAWIE